MIPQYFMMKARSRTEQILKTVLFFGLTGPLVCCAVFISISSISAIVSAAKAQNVLQKLLEITSGTFALMFFSPVSYVFGLLPAIAAGFLVAITRVVFGHVFWPTAIIIGFAVGFIDVYFGGPVRVFFVSGRPFGLKLDWWTVGAVALFYVLPTLLCWWIEQRFFQASGSPKEVSQ